MPDLTPGESVNGAFEDASASDMPSVGRLRGGHDPRELARLSAYARRRKRETKTELSNREVAEAEIRAMLESSDAKVRREGVRLLSYLEGKKQPLELVPDPKPGRGPRGVCLSQLIDLARGVGIEIATLDDVVRYAREHDLVLRPRGEGEGVGASSEPDPVPATPPTRKGTPTSL